MKLNKRIPLRRILIAFFALPVMVLVLIPTAMHVSLPRFFTEALIQFELQFIIAAIFSSIGLVLLYSTNILFIRFGHGTLAPWTPPEKLVIRGPYRYMRQPMIFGVALILLGEVFWLASWASIAWFLIFLVANMVYIPLVEEKALLARFGESYADYRHNVRSWIPRLKPWDGKIEADDQKIIQT